MSAASASASVQVQYLKWRRRPHWRFEVFELGADDHGRWFVIPAGACLQRGDEPPVVHPCTAALLIPRSGWWSAVWNSDAGQPFELYVDVVRPPEWRGRSVRMVDLDLDVVRTWQGEVEVLDRDEFEAHQRALGYPPELIDGAERATRALVARVRSGAEPFGEVGAAWLRAARAGTGPSRKS